MPTLPDNRANSVIIENAIILNSIHNTVFRNICTTGTVSPEETSSHIGLPLEVGGVH
jgi:hypothetical protein